MAKPDPGYVALQLDGVWLRGPYLHNGSVPTVRALLEPEEQRPKVFYRGYDVLDPRNGGFVSQRCAGGQSDTAGCMPEDRGWAYDVTERGNGNRGHRYGTALSGELKTALVEYLKTF
jgi:hypothetical protein